MTRIFCVALVYVLATVSAAAAAPEERAEQSRKTVKLFMGELKGELKAAMKEGGPVKAIKVCHSVAPAIAKAQSDSLGWRIGRTSLKLRNPDNAPDAWERAVLERFEARKAAGEDPKTMEFYEMVAEGDKALFRYMKAIPMAEKPCLACHGSDIKPAVAKVLEELYPDDQARGFKPGDIRGAFTITQPM